MLSQVFLRFDRVPLKSVAQISPCDYLNQCPLPDSTLAASRRRNSGDYQTCTQKLQWLAGESLYLRVVSLHSTRVRNLSHDVPLTAAEEDKARRKAAWEAQQEAQARKVYEELVLKTPKSDLVQIGASAKVEADKGAV